MLIDSARSSLLVVDLQAHLAPAIAEIDALLDKVRLLLYAAGRLGVPVTFTEQYPKGLGDTLPEILALAPGAARIEKVNFSAWAEPALPARLTELNRDQVVLVGTEAHVCLLQTGMDLLGASKTLFVVADAVGARDPGNAEVARRRLKDAGATLVTAEMVVFEWLRRADTPEFRDLLPRIK